MPALRETRRRRRVTSAALPIRLIRLIASGPGRLMLGVWTVALLLYLWGPVTYLREPGWRTWFFVGSCVGSFMIGSGAYSIVASRAERARHEQFNVATRGRLDRIVRVTAVVGLVGISCFAIDKLLLSGLDYSRGITAIRFERAQQVNLGLSDDLRRTPLLYFGYATFSFAICSYLLYLLRAESLQRSSAWLAHLSLASPVLYSVLMGGRTPIGLVLILAAGALVVRMLSGRPALPEDRTGRKLLLVLIVASIFYNAYIFSERRVFTGLSDLEALNQLFVSVYEALPSEMVLRLIENGYLSPETAMTILHTHYYFTHEYGILDRTLSYGGELGPYYGHYQLYLGSVVLGRLFPSLSMEGRMMTELQAAGVYGWFSTAWGGMFLDFGWAGGIVAVFFSAVLSAYIYRRATRFNSLRAQLLMCYVVAAILVTPMLSMLTISIGLPILVSMIITAIWLPGIDQRTRPVRDRLSGPLAASLVPATPETSPRFREEPPI